MSALSAILEVPVDDPTDKGPTSSPARSGRKRGPKLNEKERGVRAEMVLARKICGERIEAIASEFNISRATAYRALGQARRDGLYEQAKDWLHTRLLPKALAAYEVALDDGNIEAARDVLQGLGLTGRNINVGIKHEVKEDFDAWRLARLKPLLPEVIEVTDYATDPTDSQGDLAAAGGDVHAADGGGGGGDPVAPDAEGAGQEDRGDGVRGRGL